MVKYNIKLVFRNIRKHRRFFIVSVLSLAVGIAISCLLWLHISYEKSYDAFFGSADNIYRISCTVTQNGKQIINSCRTPTALSLAIPKETDLVAASTNAVWEECYMYTDNVKLFGQKVAWADNCFLNVFQHEMVYGNALTALENKYTMVISEKIAKLYFGNSNPIDKTIRLNEGIVFTVTGVFKTMPENTHLYYDFIASTATMLDYGRTKEGNWVSHNVCTYIRTKQNAAPEQIERVLSEIVSKYMADRKDKGQEVKFSLVNVRDIYLKTNLEGEYRPLGNSKKVALLTIIALFVIGIAWINNLNITTALSFEHAKEYGIRRLNGASKWSLMRYYITESIFVNLIAGLIAGIFMLITFSMFKSLVEGALIKDFHVQIWFWKAALLFFIISLFFTGILPALLQAYISPLQVIKNNTNEKFSLDNLRKGLAVFQFSLAIILIVGTVIVFKQLQFLEAQDLGIKANQVLVFRGPATNNTSGPKRYADFCSFRDELLQSPYFKCITASTNIPGQINRFNNILVSRNGQQIDASFNNSQADENYFATYQVPIIEGRNFYDNMENERNSLIINQKAVEVLGFKTPAEAIGQKIIINKKEREIVGVVKNFHHESLQKVIEPYLYVFTHPKEFGYFPSLVTGGNINIAIADAKKVWIRHYPDAIFDYFFLDEFFNRQYNTYRQLGKMVGISSLLSIFIACLGLFALVSFTVNKKTKEIGIRKVNGAKVSEILILLNRDFVKWVVIAFIIATPIAYYAMNKWLENFAYKTDLSWWIFALSGVMALGIALLTVSWQSWRAATRNPVEALRYE